MSERSWWPSGPQPRWQLAIAVTAIAAIAGALGVSAELKVVSAPTGCDATRAAQGVSPSVATVLIDDHPVGSATIVRSDGLVLATAAGMASVGPTVQIRLSDGETTQARVLGIDTPTGIAVLKIDHNKLPTLLLSAREPVSIGQPVVAIAGPLSVNGGIVTTSVSALDVAVELPENSRPDTATGAILIDKPLPTGNRGGPLVTCENRMIGLILESTAEAAVVIPAAAAQRVVMQFS